VAFNVHDDLAVQNRPPVKHEGSPISATKLAICSCDRSQQNRDVAPPSAGSRLQFGPVDGLRIEGSVMEMASCNFLVGRSVRRWSRLAINLELSRGKSIRSGPVTDQYRLTGPEFGETKPSHCFDMHEDIRRQRTARKKAKASQSIEPLDSRFFPTTFCRDSGIGTLWQL